MQLPIRRELFFLALATSTRGMSHQQLPWRPLGGPFTEAPTNTNDTDACEKPGLDSCRGVLGLLLFGRMHADLSTLQACLRAKAFFSSSESSPRNNRDSRDSRGSSGPLLVAVIILPPPNLNCLWWRWYGTCCVLVFGVLKVLCE